MSLFVGRHFFNERREKMTICFLCYIKKVEVKKNSHKIKYFFTENKLMKLKLNKAGIFVGIWSPIFHSKT